MGRRHLPRRLIATAVLAGALVGASQLFAAVIEPHNAGSQMRTAASGSLSLSNSREGAAIFTASNLAPGHSTEGTVTIANTGSAAGSLALSSAELSDSPGTYGGNLSEVLDLQIAETGSGTEVYSGTLDSMPEQKLGLLAPGDSRTYRFSVSLPESESPAADWSGENIYQSASASVGYDWTLTETLGGSGPEPPEAVPTVPVSPASIPPGTASPVTQDRPGSEPLIGSSHADTLIGTTRDDSIYGRAGADRIFGKGGNDYLLGGFGADWVYGGIGSDRLRGGLGIDHIYGGPGSDVIFARDGEADSIDCGSGRDVAFVDQSDVVRGCEVVSRAYGRLFAN
jgi:hemolysin type calcium-binding protein